MRLSKVALTFPTPTFVGVIVAITGSVVPAVGVSVSGEIALGNTDVDARPVVPGAQGWFGVKDALKGVPVSPEGADNDTVTVSAYTGGKTGATLTAPPPGMWMTPRPGTYLGIPGRPTGSR